jgi:hypothetical protein
MDSRDRSYDFKKVFISLVSLIFVYLIFDFSISNNSVKGKKKFLVKRVVDRDRITEIND